MLRACTVQPPQGTSALQCSASELNGGPCPQLRLTDCGGHFGGSALRASGLPLLKCADRQGLLLGQGRSLDRRAARPSSTNRPGKDTGSSFTGSTGTRQLSEAVAELNQGFSSADTPLDQQSLFSHLWKKASVQPRDNVPHLFQQDELNTPLDPSGGAEGSLLRGLFLSKNSYEGKQESGSVLISVPLSYALMVPVSSPKSGRAAQGKPAVVELACRLLEVLGEKRPAEASVEQEVSRKVDDDKEAAAVGSVDSEAVPLRTQELWRQLAPLLPHDFYSIADWSDEELQALQFPSDLEEVKASKEGQQVLVDLVKEATGEDEARARRAVRCVLSRSFTLSAPASTQPVHRGDQQQRWFQALIPFIDMANHAPDSVPVAQSTTQSVNGGSAGNSASPSVSKPPGRPARASATWRVAQGPPDLNLGHRHPKPEAVGAWHMQLVASSGYLGRGEEITISYGPHTSLSFLLNFGFLPDYNPGAKALLYSNLEELMDDVEQRTKFESRKGGALRTLVPEEQLFWAGEGGSAHELMNILCILHASSREEVDQLESTMRKERSLSSLHIDPATRALAARQISTRCADILSGVETSHEDDAELLLTQQDSTAPLSIALKHRMRQKGILRECEDRYKMMWSM